MIKVVIGGSLTGNEGHPQNKQVPMYLQIIYLHHSIKSTFIDYTLAHIAPKSNLKTVVVIELSKNVFT